MVTISHHAGERTELQLGGALTLPALLLHAVSDGAALAMSSTGRVGDSAGLLAVAAILHRIPEGFFVASRRQGAGARAAISAATPIAVATVAGALLGERIFELLPDSVLDGVLALGAGAMLRLVSHSHDTTEAPPPRAARAVGAIAMLGGLALVVLVPGADDVLQQAQPEELSMARSVAALFIESAPAALLGLVALAALRAYASRHPVQDVATRPGALQGFARGVAQQTPVRELRAWLAKLRGAGASPRYVTGFTIGTTQLQLDAVVLLCAWLGPQVGLARLPASLVFALMLAAFVPFVPKGAARTASQAESAAPDLGGPFAAQLVRAVEEAGAWLVGGLLLSAALEAALAPELFARLPPSLAYVLACLLASAGRTNLFGAAPVVAVLVHKGLPLGAGLAYLWLAPLTTLPLVAWLGRRALPAELARSAAAATLVSVGLGALLEQFVAPKSVPELHTLVEHDHAIWEYACAVILAASLASSLLRLGPRGFAKAAAAAQPGADHSHRHDHAHHSHGHLSEHGAHGAHETGDAHVAQAQLAQPIGR
jgi:uncharacterized membrane protein YraQ (UPF0718 family)